MFKNLLATFVVLLSTTALADVPQSDYLMYSDQLIRQYHLLKNAPLPQSRSLAFDLQGASAPLQRLAHQFMAETDAFKKRDLEAALVSAMQSKLQGSPSRFVSIRYTMYLEPYDFQARRFGLCFDDRCLGGKSHPVNSKLGALKYELSVEDAPNRIFFSPSEDIARRLESLAGKQGRRVLAVLVLEATETQERKWSDGSPYHVVKGNLAGIHLLAAPATNVEKLVAPENIIYSISKQ